MKNTLNQNNTDDPNNIEYVVEINNLKKTFKETVALDDLSFRVKKGQLYGFLGLNGAGKSTTLNIILGLLTRDSGEVKINNQSIDGDIQKIRNEIGIVFQESILDPLLTVEENLIIRASMYDSYFKARGENTKDNVEKIINELQLNEIRKRPYGKLSGGQRRRVDIARALVHHPSILFLDEPTTGLDPSTRKLVWETLANIQKERQLTILLTTHYMEEASNCEYAIIIQKGKKIVEGTPTDLKAKYATTTVKLVTTKNEELEALAKNFRGTFSYDDNGYVFKFIGYADAQEFFKEVRDTYNDFEFIKGTMDEVFLNVTGLTKEQLGEAI